MHRILPLIGAILIASQGPTPSPLAPLPPRGHCTRLDTVTTRANGKAMQHLSDYTNDSAGRKVQVITDDATQITVLAAVVGIRDNAGSRVVSVQIVFSPTGTIERADRQGDQRPFLADDSTLALMLYREMKARCGTSG